MKKYKYIILGAGPAGLSFANKLLEKGINDFIVLEKENEAGGLCRSTIVDNYPLDIGGGHFLDVRKENVLEFLFKFFPKDNWKEYTRDSKIIINNYEINSPFEANIWQFPEKEQKEYLESIKIAGCNTGEEMPKSFIEWINWKLGDKIANDYMIPYNKKMFGEELNNLGTYWLNKLPNVSYEETLKSCEDKKAYGKQPGHAMFLYPIKFGYGKLWIEMANKIKNNIIYYYKVEKLDIESKTVNDEYCAEKIICTIPWKDIKCYINLDNKFLNIINSLKYTSVVIEYFKEDIGDTSAQWIYCPGSELDYHRILVRKNFFDNANGFWTETNLTRFNNETSNYYHINEYAYPLNTINKDNNVKELLSFLSSKQIYGLGRWGEWQHYNSDVVVEKAIDLVDKIVSNN